MRLLLCVKRDLSCLKHECFQCGHYAIINNKVDHNLISPAKKKLEKDTSVCMHAKFSQTNLTAHN